MTSALSRPVAPTGLPPGVQAGPLGRRFAAHVIDLAFPVVVGVAAVVVARTVAVSAVVGIACLLVFAWWLLVWALLSRRAASPGMRAMKLQVVGYADGRPIGWGRVLVRALVLAALEATVVGVVLMLIFLVRQRRRQGWHDLIADAVVIKERLLAPPRSRTGAAESVPRARTGAESEVVSESQPVPAAVVGSVPEQDSERSPAADLPAPAAPAASATQSTPAQAPVPDPTDESIATWVALLDDGREVTVPRLLVLGRNPEPRPGEEGVETLTIPDESRTVSKSHLALGAADRGVVVTDRGSTNGSTVTDPDGTVHPCPADQAVLAGQGAIVSFGDHWLEVQQRAVPVVSAHAPVRP